MTIREEADEYADKYSDIHEYGGYKNASNAYLAAFEGPTVKALVECCRAAKSAFERNDAIDWNMFDEALQKFQEARKT